MRNKHSLQPFDRRTLYRMLDRFGLGYMCKDSQSRQDADYRVTSSSEVAPMLKNR